VPAASNLAVGWGKLELQALSTHLHPTSSFLEAYQLQLFMLVGARLIVLNSLLPSSLWQLWVG
jgi:hypothetical protein